MSDVPHVSIGLPVYQGEDYLDAAIRSIREQTYTDFELLIADNGSTDGTEGICRRHAAEDRRISYHRSPVNRGSAWNFNRLVTLARGELFKWASHDDVLRPAYLERCVAVLDGHDEAVLCQTGAATIDPQGQVLRRWPANPNAMAGPRWHRFADMVLREGPCFPVFGVIRRETLLRTELLGPYNGHDLPLLAELALAGRFVHVPDVLFLNREHSARSIRAFRGPRDRIAWFDPALADRIVFARPRLLLEYHRAIGRSSITRRDALLCYFVLVRWTAMNSLGIVHDVLGGLRAYVRSRQHRHSVTTQ